MVFSKTTCGCVARRVHGVPGPAVALTCPGCHAAVRCATAVTRYCSRAKSLLNQVANGKTVTVLELDTLCAFAALRSWCGGAVAAWLTPSHHSGSLAHARDSGWLAVPGRAGQADRAPHCAQHLYQAQERRRLRRPPRAPRRRQAHRHAVSRRLRGLSAGHATAARAPRACSIVRSFTDLSTPRSYTRGMCTMFEAVYHRSGMHTRISIHVHTTPNG